MASWQSRIYRGLARLGRTYTDFALARSVRFLRLASRRSPLAPHGVAAAAVTAGGVPCEWVGPVGGEPAAGAAIPGGGGPPLNGPCLLYLHGGGWITGWDDNHRQLGAHLAGASGLPALAVDYRLAPEYPFPAALEDCLAAYHWLVNCGLHSHQIVLVGDSAGGNLALALLLALRDAGEPLPAAAVCLSPAVDLPRRREPPGGSGGHRVEPGRGALYY